MLAPLSLVLRSLLLGASIYGPWLLNNDQNYQDARKGTTPAPASALQTEQAFEAGQDWCHHFEGQETQKDPKSSRDYPVSHGSTMALSMRASEPREASVVQWMFWALDVHCPTAINQTTEIQESQEGAKLHPIQGTIRDMASFQGLTAMGEDHTLNKASRARTEATSDGHQEEGRHTDNTSISLDRSDATRNCDKADYGGKGEQTGTSTRDPGSNQVDRRVLEVISQTTAETFTLQSIEECQSSHTEDTQKDPRRRSQMANLRPASACSSPEANSGLSGGESRATKVSPRETGDAGRGTNRDQGDHQEPARARRDTRLPIDGGSPESNRTSSVARNGNRADHNSRGRNGSRCCHKTKMPSHAAFWNTTPKDAENGTHGGNQSRHNTGIGRSMAPDSRLDMEQPQARNQGQSRTSICL